MTTPTIIFLDLPPKTFVGVDLASFNSSPNFHGITNLPVGLHLVYTGTDASLSIRHGRWLKITKTSAEAQVTVLKWNADLEYLNELDETDLETKRVLRTLPELQRRGLIDYAALREASAKLQNEQGGKTSDHVDDEAENDDDDPASTDAWPLLSSHITPRLLSRVLCPSGGTPTWTLTSISSSPLDTEHIPGLSGQETESALGHTQTLDLLPIDLKQTWPDTAHGRERTDMARDRSWYLNHVISQLTTATVGTGGDDDSSGELDKNAAAKELLGEVQFCFLMVLCLANYSCLEQWKRILSVLFTCRSALLEVEGFFVEAIKVLRGQLARVEDVEGGLFELADESASAWLRKLLKSFKGNLDEVFVDAGKGKNKEAGKQLTEAFHELEKWLNEKYGWEDEMNTLRRGLVQLEDGEMVEIQADDLDEEEETGEYAPVVVEM